MMDGKRQIVRNSKKHLELTAAEIGNVTLELRQNTGARTLLMEAAQHLHQARRKLDKALEAGGWDDYAASPRR